MNDVTAGAMPRYHQVYLLLRQKIREGLWPPGAAMPGEHELAVTHKVSRITVRSALSRLEADGLITRRRGAGTFVRPLKPELHQQNLENLFDSLFTMGERTEARLLAFVYQAAPPDVAAKLELESGRIVQKSVRVRSNGGVPFSHLTAWVPEDIGRHYRPEDLAERPMLSLLRDVGFPPVTAEQLISAKLADNVVAQLLDIEPASALIWVRRQVRTSTGRVVEYIEALYRPDLYDYRIDLFHDGEAWNHQAP